MGLRVFLDTNAIVALLKGDTKINSLVSKYSEAYISVINELEFKSFSGISNQDLSLFDAFCKRIRIINLEYEADKLKSRIIEIRKSYKLKLPDAIIAASAIEADAALVTADKEFSKIQELKLLDWQS